MTQETPQDQANAPVEETTEQAPAQQEPMLPPDENAPAAPTPAPRTTSRAAAPVNDAFKGTAAQRQAQQDLVTGSGLLSEPAPLTPVREGPLGPGGSVNAGPGAVPNAPVARAPVAPTTADVGSTVTFVMPTDFPPPYRERTARVLALYVRNRADLEVDTDLEEDSLQGPYRYPMVEYSADAKPGTWH